MKKYIQFANAPSRRELKFGLVWLVIAFVLLPSGLQLGNDLLPSPLSAAKLNFVYYCINFAVTLWIFRRFLRDSLRAALRIPFAVIWYAALGYLASKALGEILAVVTYMVYPGFSNVNDQNITSMLQSDFRLLAVGTVILVPLAEETLFRGAIFRGLYDKNATAAYLVSMALFSAIHVLGYVGAYDPVHLILCFVQYLPAAFCLCWCYRQTSTIITPILMHMIVNGMSVWNL